MSPIKLLPKLREFEEVLDISSPLSTSKAVVRLWTDSLRCTFKQVERAADSCGSACVWLPQQRLADGGVVVGGDGALGLACLPYYTLTTHWGPRVCCVRAG